ncbi:MAG: gliding motility protein GldL [Bacteroidales bacterium]|jgi:gliding motility-associated protein GldL
MGLAKLTSGRGFKNFMGKLYGLGASVVIAGALFKILHWPGANVMLIVGMLTESVIFFFSAFEKQHVEPDWSLVYPELSEIYHGRGYVTEDERKQFLSQNSGGRRISQGEIPMGIQQSGAIRELDSLMEQANIDEATLKNLGEGFNKLNNTVSSLNDITSISDAGRNLSNSLKTAEQNTTGFSDNLVKLNALYEEQIRKTNKQFEELADKMTKLYEMQIQKTSKQTDSVEVIQESMKKFADSMQDAAKFNEQYRVESAKLAENIANLNKVYGNMLSAFNFKN